MNNLRTGMRNYIRKKLRESNLDLTYEMLQVLGVLWSRGDLNQQDIADTVAKNKASLTSILDNLAKRDLIIRTEDPADRRSKIISLTKTGQVYEDELDALMNGLYITLKAKLPEKDLVYATSVITKMSENL
ncbi:MarR family winged helix-turn-helix transcriptional regulator [Sphingobacterium sp. JB170]|uniref:MarR family winged helix-turn-helix transcriptional regulator n=1 Tax=Sphingobacterium sp. JB170 TaxID=1434842 RepID=UPI0015C63AF0|nr:MarR family transcriptional regulator [Sphingobacterium sp. JB170]